LAVLQTTLASSAEQAAELQAGSKQPSTPDDESRINNLYAAYWSLLFASKDALRDPLALAKRLASGSAVTHFLQLTSTHRKTPITSTASTSALQAFKTLPPGVQNLLMAVGDVNLKISATEDALSDALSAAYASAARAGAHCVLLAAQQVQTVAARRSARVELLYTRAAQELMGGKYALFSTRATHALQQWADASVHVSLAADASQHPWLLAFKALHQAAAVKLDLITPDGLHAALLLAKRQVDYAVDGLPSAIAATSVVEPQQQTDIGARLALRMQKHELSKLRMQELAHAHASPMELAHTLRTLHVAESELQSSIDALDTVAAPALPAAQLSVAGRLDELLRQSRRMQGVLAALVEQAHILQAESTQLRAVLQAQVVHETQQEIELSIQASGACLEAAKRVLSEEHASALSRHAATVTELRTAERTLAGELVSMTRASRGDGMVLEACGKALAESARARREQRDAAALSKHKAELHRLVADVKSALVALG